MNEYNNVIIEQEDGSKTEYEVLAIFEVEAINYVALLPLNNSNDITFYGCTENEDTRELELSVIEDELEFSVVSSAFVSLMEEYTEKGI